DGDTAQVGPGLAMRLDIPYITCAQKIRESDSARFIVERMMDDGYDVVEIALPALLSVVKNINEPRVPSLKGKMRAKKAVITTLSADDINADHACIGLPGSPTQVVNVFPPPARGGRAIFTGSLDEQIDQLVDKLIPFIQPGGVQ
ncbi:MAG: electron transfer flavoprotein subunit beta, partial [Deltaproteobacteria bacterium]|nr:electron transfer flavoprotein subunit beta [Deltaproteobacteria bacterium]